MRAVANSAGGRAGTTLTLADLMALRVERSPFCARTGRVVLNKKKARINGIVFTMRVFILTV